MKLPLDIDIHTHTGPLRPDAVLCIDPTVTATLPEGEGLLSVGVHPWNADKADASVWQRLEAWAKDARVVAIGEIGLDRLRGPEMSIQLATFRKQTQLADTLCLPVIIHCVRAYDILLGTKPPETSQWIIHGFRGKPELARQLLAAGYDLSFGNLFNQATFDATPPHRRYHETD